MPALQNKTLEEAQRIVEQYDLELEYTYEANAQVEEGRILSQTPQMGVLVERGGCESGSRRIAGYAELDWHG